MIHRFVVISDQVIGKIVSRWFRFLWGPVPLNFEGSTNSRKFRPPLGGQTDWSGCGHLLFLSLHHLYEGEGGELGSRSAASKRLKLLCVGVYTLHCRVRRGIYPALHSV